MSTEIKNSNRMVWMDLLRIFATCMVPVAHLCSNVWNLTKGFDSSDYIVLNFYNAFARWVVPVFVMISGYLFLNPNKPCDTKKLYGKNIVRIVTAFLFWSFIYALQWNFFRPTKFQEEIPSATVETFFNELLTGEYHMWYLYMIVGLYLFTPLIKVFTDNATKKQLEQFILFSFIFVNLIPTILEFPLFDETKFSSVYKDLHLGFVSGYAGLYIAGQYLAQYDLGKKIRYRIYSLGILAYLFTFLANVWLSFEREKTVKDFIEVEMANVVVMGFAIFVFFKYEVSKIKVSEKAVEIISWLSARSFGVFLCHVLVMRAFQYFGLQVIHFSPDHATVNVQFLPYIHIPPIIGVPFLSAAVIVGSFMLSWVVSKIPKINKYIT